MASADAVRDRRQRAQQRLGAAEVAAAIGRERAAGWMPHEACHVEVGAERTRKPPLLRSEKAIGEIEALRARKRHHRVQVVERAVCVLGVRRPARRERCEAAADFHALQLQTPQERGGVDEHR